MQPSPLLIHEAVHRHARDPRKVALVIPGCEEASFTYRELWDRSGACAAALRARGVSPGDRVGVVMATRAETVVLVLALQRAGCTLVPLQDAPVQPEGGGRGAQVLAAARAGRARWVVTGAAAAAACQAALDAHAISAAVLPLEEVAGAPPVPEFEADAPAAPLLLIQFSSGSTAAPKGVCLTPANVAANVAAVVERTRATPDEVVVSWLPLYHDMGLIGSLFATLWVGGTLVLLRPQDFVRDPLLWIETLARRRATFTMGPQFAYSVCLQRTRGAVARARLQGLDLSSVRIALNGSETVHWELASRFAEAFADLGWNPHALQPAYGLAENCVAVTVREPGTPVPVRRLSRSALSLDELRQVPQGEGWPQEDVQITVGAGTAVEGTLLSVRDGDGREVEPGRVGQLWVCGTSAAVAYCGAEGELRSAGEGGWVATGDLGAMLDGELHVIGRIKEVIKCGGRTFVPADIEAALSAGLQGEVAGVAAFGFYDEQLGGEQLVVVAEAPRRSGEPGAPALPDQVRLCVLREFQLPVRDVVLVRPRSIPRTSSGKIQRMRLQHAYVHGDPDHLLARV